VGAAQSEPLKLVTRELEKNHVDVQSIEPAIVALVRACYSKVVKPGGNKNIMFVLLHDENMSLCVFSGQKFDFLRTKKLDFDISSSIEHAGVIAEQINSVVQFYELERVSEQKSWPVFVAGSCESSKVNEIVQHLKNYISSQNIEISVIDVSHIDIITEGAATADFSPIAAGAALKLLGVNDSAISINLLPNEIQEIRKSRSQLLIILNIAAVIFLALFLYISFLTGKTAQVRNDLRRQRHNQININIPRLVRIRADVNDRFVQIGRNVNTINTVFKDKTWHNWSSILAEVCSKTPATVQIQQLRTRDSTTVQIEGHAINYNAVNDFVNQLNSCSDISSAQLANAKQSTQYGNSLIDYSIICFLAKQEK
jgi:Tfp pilus assembly protein PilN